MELKVNNIIVLEDKSEYILLNETMYNSDKYFLALALDQNRKVKSNDAVIFEEHIIDDETYISKVVDKDLIAVLTRIFKAQS